MMVEPPGHFRRVGVFKIYDDVFIAIEDAVFPGLHSAVGHPGKLKFGALIQLLAVKAVKESGGSRAVKTAIVKTEPNLGHFCVYLPVPPTVLNVRRHKANQDVRLRQDCQEETLFPWPAEAPLHPNLIAPRSRDKTG